MSSIALGSGFAGPRATRRPSVRRPAPGPTARPVARPTGTVRLTRRGRLVLTGLFLVAVLAVLTVFGGRSAATGERGVPVQTRTVVVGEGDTLWAIASEVAAPGEVREVVHQIEELNALPGPALVEGQRLAVPVP